MQYRARVPYTDDSYYTTITDIFLILRNIQTEDNELHHRYDSTWSRRDNYQFDPT